MSALGIASWDPRCETMLSADQFCQNHTYVTRVGEAREFACAGHAVEPDGREDGDGLPVAYRPMVKGNTDVWLVDRKGAAIYHDDRTSFQSAPEDWVRRPGQLFRSTWVLEDNVWKCLESRVLLDPAAANLPLPDGSSR